MARRKCGRVRSRPVRDAGAARAFRSTSLNKLSTRFALPVPHIAVETPWASSQVLSSTALSKVPRTIVVGAFGTGDGVVKARVAICFVGA